MLGAFSNDIVCERSSRNVIFILSEFAMNLIFQRMMRGLAALFASLLITACGAHSTNQSTQTFAVYEDAPKMSQLDLGTPGNSLGDVYHFVAALHSRPISSPVTGPPGPQRLL